MNLSPRRFPRLQGTLFGGAIAATTALSLFVPGLSRSVGAALQDSPKTVVDEVWQIVNREYVDGTFNQVDWQTTRRELLSKNYATSEDAYAAIRESLKKLGDPYTRFLDPKQYEALTSQTSGELSGVGLRMEQDEKTKAVKVVEPIPNSPAAKAGVLAGDEIVAVDGKFTTGMTLDQVSALIRGEAGTPIQLKLSREGRGDFEVRLTRAQIELPSVHYTLKQEGQMRVGYISLDEFSSHAATQMRQAIADLDKQKVNAYVLDLRGNPGGLLHASIDIARMWMDSGAIVRTVDRDGADEKFSANRTAITNLPLAVLVDGNSASASEILSGALKDNRRATIVGSQTFGKALVQSVHSLSDGSGLAVTVAHYYTPNGTDISHKGVTPDVRLDLSEAQQRQFALNPTLIGTDSDPQYARAIAVLGTTRVGQSSTPRLTTQQ